MSPPSPRSPMARSIPKAGTLLYLSGADVAADLVGWLIAAGFTATRRIVYEARVVTALPASLQRAVRHHCLSTALAPPAPSPHSARPTRAHERGLHFRRGRRRSRCKSEMGTCHRRFGATGRGALARRPHHIKLPCWRKRLSPLASTPKFRPAPDSFSVRNIGKGLGIWGVLMSRDDDAERGRAEPIDVDFEPAERGYHHAPRRHRRRDGACCWRCWLQASARQAAQWRRGWRRCAPRSTARSRSRRAPACRARQRKAKAR